MKIVWTVLLTILCAESIAAQDWNKLNHFIQAQPASPAAVAFREGRDLIKDGEWQKAEARFNRFITEFPKDREVPAALYWLAFALKQESKFPAADATLSKLIAEHPSSTWLDDARTLRVEIAPRLNNSQLIEQGVSETNEEIKIAALQSLFEANPERALALAADILKPGTGSSRLVKEGALSILADSESKDAIPVLAQVARQDADLRLRRKAIEALGDIEDSSVVDELMKLLGSENDSRMQAALIEELSDIELPQAQSALSNLARTSSNIELRRHAIEALADRDEDSAALASLIQLYDAEKDESLKETIMEALGDSEEKPALQKLMQIATGDASLKLRKRAVSLIGHSDDPSATKFLEQLLKKP
jgi:HEAT repeat protein